MNIVPPASPGLSSQSVSSSTARIDSGEPRESQRAIVPLWSEAGGSEEGGCVIVVRLKLFDSRRRTVTCSGSSWIRKEICSSNPFSDKMKMNNSCVLLQVLYHFERTQKLSIIVVLS